MLSQIQRRGSRNAFPALSQQVASPKIHQSLLALIRTSFFVGKGRFIRCEVTAKSLFIKLACDWGGFRGELSGVMGGFWVFFIVIKSTKNMNLPYSSNRLLMRLKLHHLVHVALPVLHKAIVIAGDHPAVVVRPNHRPNWHCVSLRREKQTET